MKMQKQNEKKKYSAPKMETEKIKDEIFTSGETDPKATDKKWTFSRGELYGF